MKWHKFDPTFWDSETADLLEHRFKERGILIYLRIISRMALEIQTAEQVVFAHEFGWEKSLEDWARVAKYRGDSVLRVIQELHTLSKLDAVITDHSGRIRINLKFKNLRDFVHKDALSSKERRLLKEIPGGPDSGPVGRTREDKIREDKIKLSERNAHVQQPTKKLAEAKQPAKEIEAAKVQVEISSEPFEVILNPVQKAVAFYCECFKNKYGSNPPIRGKESGIIKSLVKELGMPRMLKLLEGFFAMNDQWFLTKRHSIAVFCENLNAVTIFVDTGNSLSRKQTQQAELVSNNAQVLDRVFAELEREGKDEPNNEF